MVLYWRGRVIDQLKRMSSGTCWSKIMMVVGGNQRGRSGTIAVGRELTHSG